MILTVGVIGEGWVSSGEAASSPVFIRPAGLATASAQPVVGFGAEPAPAVLVVDRADLWQRALAVGAAPLVGLHRLAFGSRRALARDMALDDLDWQDELLNIDSMNDLLAVLGDQRDQLLISELDQIHQQRRHEAITVAVVYGAAHVAPAVHGMRALHGYGVRSAEWLTVFPF